MASWLGALVPWWLDAKVPGWLRGTMMKAVLGDGGGFLSLSSSLVHCLPAPKKLLIMSKIETIVQCLREHLPQKILMPMWNHYSAGCCVIKLLSPHLMSAVEF